MAITQNAEYECVRARWRAPVRALLRKWLHGEVVRFIQNLAEQLKVKRLSQVKIKRQVWPMPARSSKFSKWLPDGGCHCLRVDRLLLSTDTDGHVALQLCKQR